MVAGVGWGSQPAKAGWAPARVTTDTTAPVAAATPANDPTTTPGKKRPVRGW